MGTDTTTVRGYPHLTHCYPYRCFELITYVPLARASQAPTSPPLCSTEATTHRPSRRSGGVGRRESHEQGTWEAEAAAATWARGLGGARFAQSTLHSSVDEPGAAKRASNRVVNLDHQRACRHLPGTYSAIVCHREPTQEAAPPLASSHRRWAENRRRQWAMALHY